MINSLRLIIGAVVAELNCELKGENWSPNSLRHCEGSRYDFFPGTPGLLIHDFPQIKIALIDQGRH